MEAHVSDRFWRAIVLHVLKNGMKDPPFHIPLILAVHGPTGEGKTFQCDAVLRQLGVQPFLLSGGQFESKRAGEPAERLRDTYLQASQFMEGDAARMAVVLVNDIDTGIGNWGESVQYTVNTQTVIGELMHLADFPCQVENTPTTRVPMIVTGNDLSKLYGPLVRPGRMSSFEWIPTTEEKAAVIASLLPGLTADDARQLLADLMIALSIDSVSRLPTAFFSQLGGSMLDDAIWAHYVSGDLSVRTVRSQGAWRAARVPTYREYLDAAVATYHANVYPSHLRRD